jgi:hypothetical protein
MSRASTINYILPCRLSVFVSGGLFLSAVYQCVLECLPHGSLPLFFTESFEAAIEVFAVDSFADRFDCISYILCFLSSYNTHLFFFGLQLPNPLFFAP